MSVTIERATPHSLGFARDPMTIPSAQSDVAGNLGVAIFLYRTDGSDVYAAPVRNGDAFTHLATLDTVNFRGQIEHQYPDVGSFDVESDLGSSGGGLRAIAAWLAFAGVDGTTPLAGTVSEEEYDSGGSWTAPSLSPGGGADDLNVSILMLNGFDGSFGDATGATIAPASGGGRTLAFDQLWEGEYLMNRPRMLVMTAPGGTAMNWSITGAQPTYAHIAFSVKAAAAGGGDPALVVDEQPSATPSGYLIDPPPTVSMTTDGSTVDTSFTGDVTAELVGAGVLVGTLTVAAVLGEAVFDDLRPCEAGSYTLRFSAAGVADLDSDPFTVTSGSGAIISGGDMPNVQLRRNEGTAALRRIYLDIEDDAGAPWAGSVTGVKAKLSQNGGSETDSPADIVRVGGGLHYVECAQAYTDIAEGSKITARVPAASGRREAKAIGEIIPGDSYAAVVSETSLTNKLVRALNGADGYIVEKDPDNGKLLLTIPTVGVVEIPCRFVTAAAQIDAIGTT